MKIYLADLNIPVFREYKKRLPENKIHVLRAYGCRSKDDQLFRTVYKDDCAGLDYDSGAFSLNNSQEISREDISFRGYLDYVKAYHSSYERIYNFDCDFGDEGFDTNIYYQKRMEDDGLEPVPVVHSINNNDEIDYYIQEGYETVALGSPQITDFGTLAYVMGKFKGTRIKIHLFGNTDFEFLTSFPIYSCDSSNWAQRSRFGEVMWWNPHKVGINKSDSVYIEEYTPPRENVKPLSEYEFKDEFLQYLNDELDLSEDDLLGVDGTLYKQLANVHYYLKREEEVNRIQKMKGFWTAE